VGAGLAVAGWDCFQCGSPVGAGDDGRWVVGFGERCAGLHGFWLWREAWKSCGWLVLAGFDWGVVLAGLGE